MCQLYPHLEWRNPTTGGLIPFKCNSWRCPECSPIKNSRIQIRLAKYADRYRLQRFLTLTLAPRGITAEMLARFVILPSYSSEPDEENTDQVILSKIEYAEYLLYECSGQEEQRNRKRFTRGTEVNRKALQQLYWRYISYVWNKYRTMLKRKYPGLSYILLKEPHKDGIRPHLHILINQYIPVKFIKESFPKYGGGTQVYIEYISDQGIQSSISYITKYLTKMANAQYANLYPRGLRRITVSRDISLRYSPEDFEILNEYQELHGNQIHGKLNEHGEPTYRCIQGHEDEYIDAMEKEPCKQCVYRRNGKCKPFSSEWRLWSHTFAGGWLSDEPANNDPVQIHNELYKPLTKTKILIWENDVEHGWIPFAHGGVDPTLLIPDILMNDLYYMSPERPEMQRWTKSRFATLEEMRLYETKHDKSFHNGSAAEISTLLC